jgi:hypothetical protein
MDVSNYLKIFGSSAEQPSSRAAEQPSSRAASHLERRQTDEMKNFIPKIFSLLLEERKEKLLVEEIYFPSRERGESNR